MKQEKRKVADAQFCAKISKKVLDGWRKTTLIRKIVEKKAMLVLAIKERKKQAKCFVKWQMYVHRRKKGKVEKSLVGKVHLMHLMRRWKRAFKVSRKMASLYYSAQEHSATQLLRKSLRSLLRYTGQQKRNRAVYQLVVLRHGYYTRSTVLHKWTNALHNLLRYKKETAIVNQALKRTCFRKWARFHSSQRSQRLLKHAAAQFYKHITLHKMAQKAFIGLKQFCDQSGYYATLCNNFRQNHTRSLLRKSFAIFLLCPLRSNLVLYNRAAETNQSLLESLATLQGKITLAEEARNTLIEQVQDEKLQAAAEAQQLETKSKELAAVEGDLVSVMEQKNFLETELIEERAKNGDAAQKVSSIAHDLDHVKSESRTGLEKLKSENAALRRRHKEISAGLKATNENRLEAEQRLRNAKMKELEHSETSEAKIRAAENVTEKLETELKRKRVAIEELKRKIGEALSDRYVRFF